MAQHEMDDFPKGPTVLSVEKHGDSDSAQLARLGKTQVLRVCPSSFLAQVPQRDRTLIARNSATLDSLLCLDLVARS